MKIMECVWFVCDEFATKLYEVAAEADIATNVGHRAAHSKT